MLRRDGWTDGRELGSSIGKQVGRSPHVLEKLHRHIQNPSWSGAVCKLNYLTERQTSTLNPTHEWISGISYLRKGREGVVYYTLPCPARYLAETEDATYLYPR